MYDDLAVLDVEGIELPDDEAAHETALRNAREIACAEVEHGQLVLKHQIDMVDENGRQVGVVSFGTAVGLDPPTP